MDDDKEVDALRKDRKTIRAALVLAPMGPIQRELVGSMVDRHFDAMERLAVRVTELEADMNALKHERPISWPRQT